jgi:hypothetical protein
VPSIANHNIAFRHISPQSKYCKLVSADDWLYPECLQKQVDLAERSPSVGIVQAYAINDNGVRWPGLRHDTSIFNGREVSRLFFPGKIEFAAIPSAALYCSSLVRARESFFPGSHASADSAAHLNCPQQSDLGFVHQILSFERIHPESVTAKKVEMRSYLLDRCELLLKYGPSILTSHEFDSRLREMLRNYYRVLAHDLVNLRITTYLRCHKTRCKEIGYPFRHLNLCKAVSLTLLDLLLNPKHTIETVIRRVGTARTIRAEAR